MKKFLLPALLAVALGLSACGSSGTAGGGTAPTSPVIQALVNARYQIVLKDIATDTPITDPLVLTFSGTAALKAADGSSLNGKSVTTTVGFYGVDAAFTSGSDDFTVKVTDGGSKGWVTSGVTINGEAAATGDRLVEVKLLNPNNAAQVNASAVPVTVAVQSTNVAANGALTAAVTTTTPAKTVTTAEGTTEPLPTTQVTLPAGAIATTANGTPAAAGQLTVTAATFSNANVESLQAFPGGFAPAVSSTNAAALNGVAADAGAVTTAGFANFTVKDSAGNAIRNFSQPVTISFDLAKGTLDGNGNPVAVGTQYPIWSFNETTQSWTFETFGTVAEKNPVDPNFFTVNFQTSHLSWWSWFVWRPTCNSTVTLTGRPAGDTRLLDVAVVGVKRTRFFSFASTTGNSVRFLRLPNNSTATVLVFDKGNVVGQVPNAAVCGGVTVPVTIPQTPVGTIRYETSEACADGTNQRPVPTFVNAVAGTQFFLGYTGTLETNLASTSLTGLPTGALTASAFNPRTNQWESQGVTVTANTSTTAQFKFVMNCAPVTGGF